MAFTEEEWIAIRNSYFNPEGFWRSGGYDAGSKKWFLTDAKTSTYKNYTEAQVKEEFLNYRMRDLQEQFTTAKQMPAWGITKPRAPTEPEYPKNIKREPYLFTVGNAEEETQVKDFLGIEPAGVDLDTHVSRLDEDGLNKWWAYWARTFEALGREDIKLFVDEKWKEYKAKLVEPEPEISWWEKMLARIVEASPWVIGIKFDPLKTIVEKALGIELTEEQWLAQQTKFLEWTTPFNVLSKLFFGKNLKGEDEEFGTADDWIELAIYGVGILIPGQVDEAAMKLGLKSISKSEAAALSAKMGNKEIVAALKTAVREHPETSAKFLAKFPKAVREAVISGLYKTAWGREAIYTLGKRGYWKAIQPWWKSTLVKAGMATGIAGLFIGAIGSYPFAGFIKEEAIQNLDFAIKAATDNKDIEGLRKAIDQKRELLDATVWEKILSYIPYANILDQLKDFFEAARTKLGIDETTFETKKAEWEEEAAPKGTLIVSPTPADAEVSVDKLPYVDSAFEEIVPTGSYHVLVTKWEYVSQDKYLEVKENEVTTWSPTLKKETVPEPMKAKLTISVTPEDAKIEVADHPEITKSDIYEVSPGSYTIDFSKEGYESARRTVYLDEGETEIVAVILKEVEVPLPPEEVVGTLTISVTPEDALIEVAGYEEIKTAGTYELTPGSYSIRASKEGFVTDIKTAFVTEKEDKMVSFILESVEPIPTPIKKATITITSEPIDSDVYIDGVYKWTTTPYTILLDKGFYWIRVQKEGYYPIEVEAEVEAGEESTLPFPLTKIPEPEIPEFPYIPQTPYYPTYEPAEVYTPSVVTTPSYELPVYDYSKLYPEVMMIPEVEPISPPTEKELLINIETTDLMPTKGRIYSIAFLDLTTPGAEIQVAVLNDEDVLINGFLDFFETGMYTKLVGYNVSFDYRYIFTKMMKYRRSSKAWKNVKLIDVMQIMKQVKEEFVFGYNKPGTLDAWGKMILGRGKYGSQELMLRKYISGDFNYVRAFQVRQIELTRDLYALSRFCSGEGFISSPTPIPEEISSIIPSETPETPAIQGKKTCPTCMAYNPLSATICEICGAVI